MPTPGTASAIRFTARMIPTAKGRPRSFVRNGHARVYTPSKTDQAERDFIALADPHAPERPFEGPISLSLRFVFPIPQSWSRVKRQRAWWHVSKPDLSNVVKTVEDALNRSGRWWRDDSQIARLAVEKVYGPAPQIEVEVAQLGGGADSAVETSGPTQGAAEPVPKLFGNREGGRAIAPESGRTQVHRPPEKFLGVRS
jgi:Holliday junction resolvase RusA-like endonuclease